MKKDILQSPIILFAITALIAASFGSLGGYVGAMFAPQGTGGDFGAVVIRKDEQKKESTAPSLKNEEDIVVATVERATNAVVSIVITKDVPVYERVFVNPFGNDDFFSQFFSVPEVRQKGTEKKRVGAGTGFLVSEDGYIITNKHVVVDTDAEYTVIFSDKSKLAAEVLARDPSNDIAILKVKRDKPFPFLSFANSESIRVGQKTIAIGFALGEFGNSVSLGIVSGLHRSISAGDSSGNSEQLFGVIQTDSAINPGNSGGPLLNLRGEVIGVNVAIVQGSQNIGFALPANDVKRALEAVKKTGKISRPFLGVRYVMVNKEIADKNQLSIDYGALVIRGAGHGELAVAPGSPADRAGIIENDIILKINGEKLTEDYPLAAVISRAQTGDTLTITVFRKGEEITLTTVLSEKK